MLNFGQCPVCRTFCDLDAHQCPAPYEIYEVFPGNEDPGQIPNRKPALVHGSNEEDAAKWFLQRKYEWDNECTEMAVIVVDPISREKKMFDLWVEFEPKYESNEIREES
jgi:C4-type Zn-finger protein